MNLTVDELVQQAQQLSVEEQALLSDRILELVCQHDDAWEAAWVAECKDRIAACERGEMVTHDSDEVMANLRQKYDLK